MPSVAWRKRHVRVKAIVLALFLAGCSGVTQNVPQTVRLPRVAPPTIQPLTMEPVTWRVMTESEIRALAESREEVVLFALDPDGYRNMRINLIEIRRFLDEQRAAIAFLQRILDERSEPPPGETTDAPAALQPRSEPPS